MRRLFLSYSHKDANFADSLYKYLTNNGVVVWIDKYEIDVGDSIVWRISHALGEHDYFAAILSPAYLNSKWCKRELASYISTSFMRGATVLPILYHDCEIPAILADIAYADFRRSYSRGLEGLIKAIHRVRKAKERSTDKKQLILGNLTSKHNASCGIDVVDFKGKKVHFPITYTLDDSRRMEPNDEDFSIEFDLTNNTSSEIRILGLEVDVTKWRPLEKVLGIVPYMGLGEKRLFFGAFQKEPGSYPCYFSVPNGYVKLWPHEFEVFKVQINTTDEGVYDLRILVNWSIMGNTHQLSTATIQNLHFVGRATRWRPHRREFLD